MAQGGWARCRTPFLGDAMRISCAVLLLLVPISAFAQHQQSVWWCKVDDSQNAVRYLPGRAIPADRQSQAAMAFMQAIETQYPKASTGQIACGPSSVKGYHDWVASNLSDTRKAGWEVTFVSVQAAPTDTASAKNPPKPPSAPQGNEKCDELKASMVQQKAKIEEIKRSDVNGSSLGPMVAAAVGYENTRKEYIAKCVP